jgi:L-aminopeptidase/D-esterase-like protein
MKGLTDIPGIRVGHVSDYEAITGCTAIVIEGGAIGGVDIRGSATGTQEIDTLNPLHVTPELHGLCLSGGSAFGLEAASGVRKYLEGIGVGYPTGAAKVPIVPGAILYDLGIGKSTVRPTREMGQAAAMAATTDAVAQGNVGAGTGATVGKANGMKCAMKGGLGSYTVTLPGNILVSALVAVNALGDIIDPTTGKVVAGARKASDSRDFLDATKAIREGMRMKSAASNTVKAVQNASDETRATDASWTGPNNFAGTYDLRWRYFVRFVRRHTNGGLRDARRGSRRGDGASDPSSRAVRPNPGWSPRVGITAKQRQLPMRPRFRGKP